MSTTLAAQPRTLTGSANARRLRTADHVPAVVYGKGMEPVSITVERRDLRDAMSGPEGTSTVVSLNVAGTTYTAVVKDIQRHPVKRTVSHVDFHVVDGK
ncbi:MAG: 50S ribosomal protein L25 [Ilumatobacteraceae bacterium]|jgi:large subunit ribosomal protein L25